MILLEFSMSPLVQGDDPDKYVAQLADIVARSGLDYQITPMGMILEGEWLDAMAVVNACFEAVSVESDRISVNIKIDYRASSTRRLPS